MGNTMAEYRIVPELSAGAYATGHQMVTCSLPPDEVLLEIGRATVRFGQLEHVLKLIHKRTTPGMLLRMVLNLKVSLGGLLRGANKWGESIEFEGLLKRAEENPQLASIHDLLTRASGLVETRNKYLHNGLGRTAQGRFVFMKSGEPVELGNLQAASELTEQLIYEMNKKIPPPR
jgi:hypothetical protein